MRLLLIFLFCSLSGFVQAESAKTVLMPGKVIQGHAKYEDDCDQCHKSFDKTAQDKLCADCHKEVGKDLADKMGFHGRMEDKKACKECHEEHKGRGAVIVHLDEKQFEHNKLADYELKGKHEKVECNLCHPRNVKHRKAPHDCYSCHKKDDDKAHKGRLGKKCQDCHSEKDWKKVTFDHDKTKYPLKFKHKDVKCADCHKNSEYKKTPQQCYACHKKDDDKSHKGRYGQKCETCHTEQDWKKPIFDHDKKTKYPLKGKHDNVKCKECHTGNLYKDKLDTKCISCHKKADEKTHKGRYGAKCETCHNELDWKKSLFNHDKSTKYPLKGKHAQTKCDTCHTGHLYNDKLKQECMPCHKKADEKTHKGRYGVKCETCHNELDWKKSLFNHDKNTKYPLKGKHAQTKCDTCHTGHVYNDKLKTVCIACHKKDDDKSHKGQLGDKCETCHVEKTWKDIPGFNHNRTKYPLLGRHIPVECKKCHEGFTYKDAKSECIACHKKEDEKTHKRSMGTKCELCHNVRDWKAWDFDHNRKTKYKLDGGHKKVACVECHNRPMDKVVVKSTTCVSCHEEQDVHSGGFSRYCERCHTTNSWKEIVNMSGRR